MTLTISDTNRTSDTDTPVSGEHPQGCWWGFPTTRASFPPPPASPHHVMPTHASRKPNWTLKIWKHPLRASGITPHFIGNWKIGAHEGKEALLEAARELDTQCHARFADRHTQRYPHPGVMRRDRACPGTYNHSAQLPASRNTCHAVVPGTGINQPCRPASEPLHLSLAGSRGRPEAMASGYRSFRKKSEHRLHLGQNQSALSGVMRPHATGQW